MQQKFQELEKFLSDENNIIETFNPNLKKVVVEYSFLYFSELLSTDKNQIIFQNVKDSNVIVIDYHEEKTPKADDDHFIIGFKKTIIIINQSKLSNIKNIFTNNQQIEFVFMSKNAKNAFDQSIDLKYKEATNLGDEKNFKVEIVSFNQNLRNRKKYSYSEIWEIIYPCISGYLIKHSYSKSNFNRINNSSKKLNVKNIDEFDYIELRTVGIGSYFKTELIYKIDTEDLFIIKTINILYDDIEKLIKREEDNYKKISHRFLPKFYGMAEYSNNSCIAIEFINGTLLSDIK